MELSIRIKSTGQSLIELLVAIGLLSILLPAILTGLISSREGKPQQQQRFEATLLLKESEQSVRVVREKGWSNLTNGVYHPVTVGSSWDLAAGSENISGFTRQIVISDAQRDTSGNIVETGGTTDYSIKKIIASVSWNTPIPSSASSISYLSRYLNNSTWMQTTQTEFSLGTLSNTQVVFTGDGAVGLTPVSGGNWNSPQVIASRNFSGAQDANDVFISGNFAYIVTVSRTGADFFIYNISTPSNPTLAGSLDLASTGYKIVVSGNFAYITSSHDSRELTIVNVTNPATPAIIGSFNSPTAADGRGVAVSGNTAYLVTDNNTTGPGFEFYSINVTDPATPSQVGGINLAASARDVYISSNNAFVASTSNTQELQVVSIINPASPTLNGVFNASSASDALAIYVSGNTAYLGAGSVFFLLNIASLPAITQISTFSSGGTVFEAFVSDNFAFIANGQASYQFKVVDITVPATPTLFGSANLGGNGIGLFVSGNFAYLSTANDTGEFQVIEGGTGGGFQVSGTFESQTFDCTIPTAPAAVICNGGKAGYNYFAANTSESVGNTINFKVAMKDIDSGWLNGDFVGPDGTTGSFFDNAGGIAIPSNFRYFRFKAYFTGNDSETPTLLDAILNYSP